MKKPNRFLIYILIIIVLFFLVEENDVERDQLHEWILPLIVVVVILQFGLKFFRKDRKE